MADRLPCTLVVLSASPLVIAAQILVIGLSAWARHSFPPGQFTITAEPKAGPLLSTGPDQWIRHPMSAAALLLLWASILGHLSLPNHWLPQGRAPT